MNSVREPVAKVELSFQCNHLVRLDKLSKSDPYIVISMKDHQDSSPWKEIGKTETIMNNQNPKFKTSVIVDYYFERVQLLRFEVWDYDTHNPDYIGDFDCKLGEIVGARGQLKTAELRNPKKGSRKNGSITIYAEEIYKPPQFSSLEQQQLNIQLIPSADLQTEITQLQASLTSIPAQIASVSQSFKSNCSGKNLDKKDLLGKSDPYFKIYRIREQESILVFESEVQMKTLNPTWNPLSIDLQKLCNNDTLRPLKVEVYDWDKLSSHDLIGIFEFSVDSVLKGKTEFPIIHPEKKQKKGAKYENSGIFIFSNTSLTAVESFIPNPQYSEITNRLNAALEKKKEFDKKAFEQYRYKYQVVQNPHSFVQYLAGGCEISLIVAIDFTGSNGDPSSSSSLHYISSKRPNEYQQAIHAVGNILADYDYDKIFQTYGFGGKYNGSTSHAFPLNGSDANCVGVEGILETYAQAIRKYSLSGPTYFHEIINKAKETASTFVNQQNQKYFILLIITDGVIESIDHTIRSIIEASSYPLSIVIVGVGNANFDSMDQLDADQKPLETSSNGKMIWAARDIVQFVPFSKFKHDAQKLAEETLAEIPRQLVYFMGQKGIVPNAKVKVEPVIPIPPSYDI